MKPEQQVERGIFLAVDRPLAALVLLGVPAGL
jgi:hypothetical protein